MEKAALRAQRRALKAQAAAATSGAPKATPKRTPPPPPPTLPSGASPAAPTKPTVKTSLAFSVGPAAKTGFGQSTPRFDFPDATEDELYATIEDMQQQAIRRFGKFSKKWPQQVWNLIIKLIDDDLVAQMKGVTAPNVAHLLTEIRHAVAAAVAKPAGHYRKVFYALKMEPHGDTATLQLYAAKFASTLLELEKGGQPVPDLERNHTSNNVRIS